MTSTLLIFTNIPMGRANLCAIGFQLQIRYAFRGKRTCSRWIRRARPGEFLKLFVDKSTQQLASLVIIQGGNSTFAPKQSHILYGIVWGQKSSCVHALSLGPRLTLFSEVSKEIFLKLEICESQDHAKDFGRTASS